MIRRLALLALVCLALPALSQASGKEAEDITLSCVYTTKYATEKRLLKLYDRKYTTYWGPHSGAEKDLIITLPEDKTPGFLYICFGIAPEGFRVQAEKEGALIDFAHDISGFAHVYVPLSSEYRTYRIVYDDPSTEIRINELFVFAAGEIPDFVQRWEPTAQRADILLLTAHPDDEALWFGGLIPEYAGEKGVRVVAALMTQSNTTRLSEYLNSLWHMGLRDYPVIGSFYDAYSKSLEDAYKKWSRTDTRDFVMGVIRQYKPSVIVTHDIGGEYGHGAHRLCADVALYCAQNASDPAICPESAQKFGLWVVPKLYLHLYEENQITLDWTRALDTFEGRTGYEVAAEAFSLHVTQESSGFDFEIGGQCDNALFGLALTNVGPDIEKNDFLENVDSEAFDRMAAENQPLPTPTPVPTATPLPTATPSPTATALPLVTPASAPALPALSESGFLPEGEAEYVYADEEKGLWVYLSQTLRVEISRVTDETLPCIYFVADIYSDAEAGETVKTWLYNPEKPRAKHVHPEIVAQKYGLVFALNTDYYTYRVGSSKMGAVIRDGQIFFSTAPAAHRSKFPPLDILALYPDGDMKVYYSDEITAEQLISDGARDALSFGPILVRDGELGPDVRKYGKTAQPRCAIGMVEKGHYVAILSQGRFKTTSPGLSVLQLAELMLQKGCQTAFNLDGGQTAVILFMGQQLNEIAPYSGGKTYPRFTTELIGIGQSENVEITR